MGRESRYQVYVKFLDDLENGIESDHLIFEGEDFNEIMDKTRELIELGAKIYEVTIFVNWWND